MEESQKFVLSLRGKTELLKAYFLIGWEMKFISHGLFADISEKLEAISKQAYSWSEWFQKQIKAGGNLSWGCRFTPLNNICEVSPFEYNKYSTGVTTVTGNRSFRIYFGMCLRSFPLSTQNAGRIKSIVQVRLYALLQWRDNRSRVADTPNNGNWVVFNESNGNWNNNNYTNTNDCRCVRWGCYGCFSETQKNILPLFLYCFVLLQSDLSDW